MKTLITPKYYIPLNELESISETMETLQVIAHNFPALKECLGKYFSDPTVYHNPDECDLKIKVQATLLFIERLGLNKNSSNFFDVFREVLGNRTKENQSNPEWIDNMNDLLASKYSISNENLWEMDESLPIKKLASIGFLLEVNTRSKVLRDFIKVYTLDDSEIEALEEIIDYTESSLGCKVKNITATPRKSIDEDPYVVFTLENHDPNVELIVNPTLWERFRNTITDASTHYVVYSAMNFSTPDMLEQLVFLFSDKGND